MSARPSGPPAEPLDDVLDEDERDKCACGHPHTAGRFGVCSSFLCPCKVWRAP